MRIITLLLSLTACPAPTWMEHPCGRGDPVEFTCTDTDDVILQEPSTALCEEIGAVPGAECETGTEPCVQLQAYACASEPDGPTNSEALLHCRRQAWGPDDALCPQSSRSVKREIVYVDAEERQALSRQVLAVKLARYRYRDPSSPGRKLGYILEDSPEAAFSGEGRVDLYAYLSALVATSQEQQRRIEALEAQVEALRAGTAPSPSPSTTLRP